MRPVSFSDLPLITDRLRWLKSKGGMLPAHADVDTALAGIVEYNRNHGAIIASGFLILYDIGTEWFSNRRVLYEQFVMKLNLEAQAVMVPAILEQLATTLGCEAMVAGDSLAGKMTPSYEYAGWKPLGTTLTKEIANVRRQSGQGIQPCQEAHHERNGCAGAD